MYLANSSLPGTQFDPLKSPPENKICNTWMVLFQKRKQYLKKLFFEFDQIIKASLEYSRIFGLNQFVPRTQCATGEGRFTKVWFSTVFAYVQKIGKMWLKNHWNPFWATLLHGFRVGHNHEKWPFWAIIWQIGDI